MHASPGGAGLRASGGGAPQLRAGSGFRGHLALLSRLCGLHRLRALRARRERAAAQPHRPARRAGARSARRTARAGLRRRRVRHVRPAHSQRDRLARRALRSARAARASARDRLGPARAARLRGAPAHGVQSASWWHAPATRCTAATTSPATRVNTQRGCAPWLDATRSWRARACWQGIEGFFAMSPATAVPAEGKQAGAGVRVSGRPGAHPRRGAASTGRSLLPRS